MANADALSRLPLQKHRTEVPQPPEVIHVMEQLDSSPLSSTQIRLRTEKDPVLSVARSGQRGGTRPTTLLTEEV